MSPAGRAVGTGAGGLIAGRPCGCADADSARPIFVVGVQKSGTSLLHAPARLDRRRAQPVPRGRGTRSGATSRRSARPATRPGGSTNSTAGSAGHRLTRGGRDPGGVAPPARAPRGARRRPARPIVNKNPYNTVRIAWLRAVFPDALIVAVVRVRRAQRVLARQEARAARGRRPAARGGLVGRQAGGMAVAGRRRTSCSRAPGSGRRSTRVLLGSATTSTSSSATPCCARDPGRCCARSERPAGTRRAPRSTVPELRCHDDEYRTGSRLRSKNRYSRERGSLETPAARAGGVPAVTPGAGRGRPSAHPT